MTGKEYAPIEATRTSFRVIHAIKELDGPNASTIASYLDMPVSTVYDHLRTLQTEGYVVCENGQYKIGLRFLDLGGYARSQRQIYQVTRPELRELADETGEHANLMVEENGWGVFLTRARGEDALAIDTYDGMLVELQATALGKAIMAFMPEERVTEIVDQHGFTAYTENTVTGWDELLEELESIRERGLAIDNEERLLGVRCVAAPIVGQDGNALGAISISGPTSRMQGTEFEEEYPRMVRNAVNVVEVNLTYG